MTMLSSEPAICKKCGSKQFYTNVISWNAWITPEYPAHNRCYKCGTEIKYEDIDLSTCSPSHRQLLRRSKIYDYLGSFYEEDNKCPKCGSDKFWYRSLCGLELPDKYKCCEGYSVEKSWYECEECKYTEYMTAEHIRSTELYEVVEKGNGEHEYIIKETERHNDIIEQQNKQAEEEFNQAEDFLISQGLITTREEEKEYEKEYYEKLAQWRKEYCEKSTRFYKTCRE